jgi:hypothetical protein
MLQAGLLIVSLAALATPIALGGRVDRWGAAFLLADMLLSPLAQDLMIDDFRWGVALVDLACALGLIGLALRADRWWLLFAAGLQIAVVLTHLAALGPAFIYNWTAVTVRLATWIALLIVLLGGACEAHLVRRYQLAPLRSV